MAQPNGRSCPVLLSTRYAAIVSSAMLVANAKRSGGTMPIETSVETDPNAFDAVTLKSCSALGACGRPAIAPVSGSSCSPAGSDGVTPNESTSPTTLGTFGAIGTPAAYSAGLRGYWS